MLNMYKKCIGCIRKMYDVYEKKLDIKTYI